jgi:hypothetical protein
MVGGGGSSGFPQSSELYNPVTKYFQVSASLQNPRRFAHSATLLNDGTRVLVTGGTDQEYLVSPTNTAEIYEVDTAKFRFIKPMAINQAYHTATLLQDSRRVY